MGDRYLQQSKQSKKQSKTTTVEAFWETFKKIYLHFLVHFTSLFSHQYTSQLTCKIIFESTLITHLKSLKVASSIAVGHISSVSQPCPILYYPMDGNTPGFPVHTDSWSLIKLMSIEAVMPSNHLILCQHLLILTSIFPSCRFSSNESILHIRWPKYWTFSFSPSNAYSGLVSFRMDWFYLLAVQGTLKSLLQQHSSKASILWHSALYVPTFAWNIPLVSLTFLKKSLVFPILLFSSIPLHCSLRNVI